MREKVYHDLGKQTMLDLKIQGAQLGYPSPAQPWPPVQVVNQCIWDATAQLNRTVGFEGSGAPYMMTIPGQTANGPYYYDARVMPGIPEGKLNSISRMWWSSSATSTAQRTPIAPKTYEALDRDNSGWMNWAPGIPQYFIIDSSTVGILPAPSVTTYLWVSGGLSITAPVVDGDGFTSLPMDYEPAIRYMADVLVCAKRPLDVQFKQIGEQYKPLAAQAVQDVQDWYNSTMEEYIPQVQYASPRLYYGRRR